MKLFFLRTWNRGVEVVVKPVRCFVREPNKLDAHSYTRVRGLNGPSSIDVFAGYPHGEIDHGIRRQGEDRRQIASAKAQITGVASKGEISARFFDFDFNAYRIARVPSSLHK
jgi:hypothetical protein